VVGVEVEGVEVEPLRLHLGPLGDLPAHRHEDVADVLLERLQRVPGAARQPRGRQRDVDGLLDQHAGVALVLELDLAALESLADLGAGQPDALARLGLADPAVAVLQEEGDPRLADAARAALRQAGQRGWKRVEVGPLGPPEQARERVAQLASKGVEVVLLLGDDRALEAFLVEAAAASWTPWVLVPGILAARAASTAPAAFEGRLLLGYPSLPSDETEAGGAHLASLSTEVERRHHAARASAASAVAVVGEALRRTGRNLSRARFVASLEALYRLETGLGPPISFGVRRRVGALGGYVVAVDLAKRSFTPASGWIRLD